MHSPRQRTLAAPAKINLLLRILGREESGYHGIETLFQRLALHDIVHVALVDDARTLDCDGPTLPPGGLGEPESNLAWRAAAAYADATGWDTGWHIAIEKHIPVGGGLGGGSADAAAVLRALEAMAPQPLGRAALMALAGTLGADVPFLLGGASLALAWNRGDRLLTLPALPQMAVTLVTFEEGVHTGVAYEAFATARRTAGDTVAARHYPVDVFASWERVAAIAENDFERVVAELHDDVARTLPALQSVADGLRSRGIPAIARLSGSGATCYLVHPMEAALLVDADTLPAAATVHVTATA